MVSIEKLYFTVREIAERWQVQMDDLAYMAENGQLRVSVRLYSTHLERGVYELDPRDGHPFKIPHERDWFSGLQDLSACDAYKVFRDGRAQVGFFDAPGDAYVALIEPNDWMTFHIGQLVVRREERDRIEAAYSKGGHSIAEGIVFQHDDEFRTLRLGRIHLSLGRLQAAIVKRLYEASRSGDGWCYGKTLLAEVGSSSKRMADLFKSKPEWRFFIESDGRGRYRFRIRLR